MLEDESQLPPQQGPTRMQIFVANKLTTIFPLLHNRVVKEQKMACPSNTPYAILKDGIVLLEHDACLIQALLEKRSTTITESDHTHKSASNVNRVHTADFRVDELRRDFKSVLC